MALTSDNASSAAFSGNRFASIAENFSTHTSMSDMGGREVAGRPAGWTSSEVMSLISTNLSDSIFCAMAAVPCSVQLGQISCAAVCVALAAAARSSPAKEPGAEGVLAIGMFQLAPNPGGSKCEVV